MKMMIVGIVIAAGAAFFLWCCLRVSAMADRAMGITDSMEEGMAIHGRPKEAAEEGNPE